MNLPPNAELLRVFIGEEDKYKHKPLYEAIVEQARERGMAGGTVLKGCMGFGANSRMHTSKLLRISEDMPIIVEIIDKPERIAEFIPILDSIMEEGLVTREQVNVIIYRHNKKTWDKDNV